MFVFEIRKRINEFGNHVYDLQTNKQIIIGGPTQIGYEEDKYYFATLPL